MLLSTVAIFFYFVIVSAQLGSDQLTCPLTCENGGICTILYNPEGECICKPFYKGQLCEEPVPRKQHNFEDKNEFIVTVNSNFTYHTGDLLIPRYGYDRTDGFGIIGSKNRFILATPAVGKVEGWDYCIQFAYFMSGSKTRLVVTFGPPVSSTPPLWTTENNAVKEIGDWVPVSVNFKGVKKQDRSITIIGETKEEIDSFLAIDEIDAYEGHCQKM